MGAGDRWRLPDGREGIELDGSSGGQLHLAMLNANPTWPFQLTGAEVAVRALCLRLPSRYHHQAQPGADKLNPADVPDALL
jgi:hypothetical protein